jgi:hypothetical protein
MRWLAYVVLLAAVGCSGAIPKALQEKDLGPECKKFIERFEQLCNAPDTPALGCSPEAKVSLAAIKKGPSSPEQEKTCELGNETFVMLDKMSKSTEARAAASCRVSAST